MRDAIRTATINTRPLVISIATGMACGMLYVALDCGVSLAWERMITYAWNISSIGRMQSILLGALAAMFAGCLSARLSGEYIRRSRDAMIAGAFSGASAGAILAYFNYVSHIIAGPAGYLTCTPASYLSYAVGLFQHNAWFALLLVSIYTTMAAISGYVCYAVDLKGKGQERAMGPGPVAALELSFLSVLVIFIAAMVVVPAGTITLMLYTGLVEDETPSFSHTVAVYAVQTDDNTICVINLGGEGKNLLNEGLPFLVYIDGKNVTDSAAIKESGLSLDISPASRLGRKAGSSVNYTGTDAAFGNNSVHVLVVGNYRDGVRENLLSMDIGRDKAI